MTANSRLTTEFEFNGKTYEAAIQKRDYSSRQRTKPKGYCWGPGDDRNPSVEFRFLAEYVGAPSVYTSRGEYPALDKAFDKMNREIVAAKTEVFKTALLALGMDEASVEAKGAVKFSRKAGCSCGCSPGFLLNVGDVLTGETVYVEEKK